MSSGPAADAEPETSDRPNTIRVAAQKANVFLIEYLLSLIH
jgi:hypothetical protein